ncbi:MAG: DNA mismatch repair protein MutS [Chloroflexota bacterium]|nr:DNA mismatch repair protein MutS [Chloroflexota bacterium]
MSTTTLTPLRRQYLDIKRQHPESLLFFRLGDFYELFDRDAEVAAEELQIVLTSREFGRSGRSPMCGVPHHAVAGYIAKLVEAGHRVAVCDQVTAAGNGLVDRAVTRVITPGTVVDEDMLRPQANNYLAAVVPADNLVGFAYADVTTGEFSATEVRHDQLGPELSRVSPRETLAFGDIDLPGAVTGADWMADPGTAEEALRRQFTVQDLDGLGLADRPQASRAAGALLAYVAETDANALHVLAGLHVYRVSTYMELDPATRANLELESGGRASRRDHSVLGVLDHTRTPMGARRLRRHLARPSLERDVIERRLDLVEALVDASDRRAELHDVLKSVGDLERLANRVLRRTAAVNDVRRVATALEGLALVRRTLDGATGALAGPRDRIDTCEEAQDLIARAIDDGDRTIRAGYSDELDRLVAGAGSAKAWIAALETQERERLGIKSLKVRFNRVFGYYIELGRAYADRVPDHYERRQTLANAERYVIPELKEREAEVLNAQEQIEALETLLFEEVVERLAAWAPAMLGSSAAIAALDVAASLAEVAVLQGYVRPLLTNEGRIEIEAGRHPVVEASQTEPFVPNDTRLDPDDRQILVLTGPNMAGKSTYLRQTALIVLLAQIGSYVPAERAEISLVDRIFTRAGARDDLAAGASTFMVEMLELAAILAQATPRSLLILDEIGRGTSTYDGISVAQAVVEHLHHHPRLRAKTIFATHYHELTAVAEMLPRVHNANVAVAEQGERVLFLRRIVDGPADRSYGVQVAQLAGLPPPVIRRAREILVELERLAAGGKAAPSVQLTLLTPEEHPVVKRLRELDPEQLSPLDALSLLYELRNEADA